jgi:hypothetical protein
MVPNADEGRGARANAGGPIGRARLIGRVAADPARVPSAGRPGGTLRLLHGAFRVRLGLPFDLGGRNTRVDC